MVVGDQDADAGEGGWLDRRILSLVPRQDGGGGRNPEPEPAAFADVAFDPDLAAHGLDQAFADRQP